MKVRLLRLLRGLCCTAAVWGLLTYAAYGQEDTNIVAAAQTDEEAGWESVFVQENQIPFHINLYMKEGLYYELMESSEFQAAFFTSVFSEKRRLTGRLGLKVHADAGYFDDSGNVPPTDSDVILRRFRLNTFGRAFLFTPLTYGLEFGVSDGNFYLNDGYIWFHSVPFVKSVRGGVFTPPMSLEAPQSGSVTPMMEYAAPVSAFTPGELFGIQLGGEIFKKRGSLHAGWFSDMVDSEYRDASQSYSRIISRLTWLLRDSVDENEDGTIIHIGASGSHMFSAGNGVQFKARPESYMAPVFVDTGTLDGDQAFIYGLESAWQKNNLLIQAEYLQAYADDDLNVMHTFQGAYVMGSWIVTGERKSYNRDGGFFSRVEPKKPFSFRKRNWGALEVVGRLSYTDMNDKAIRGGKMTVASAGINLYMKPRWRIMLNAGYADVKSAQDATTGLPSDGELLFVQSRLQIEL